MTSKNSWPKNTKVYCWKFLLPVNGWIGGLPDEFWHPDRSKIAALMEHCIHPSRIIDAVSDGSGVRR